MTPDELIREYIAKGGNVTKLPMRGPRLGQWRENARRAAKGQKPNATMNLKPNYYRWRHKLEQFSRRVN